MKLINHLIYQCILIFYLLKKFPFLLFFEKYKKKSNNVVWILPQFPFGLFKYLGSAAIFQDMALVFSLLNELDDIRFIFGPKIGKLRKINFFYSFTDKYNPFSFESDSRFLSETISLLESQECRIYPTLNELALWEDKEFMYEMFERFQIPFPKTKIINTLNEESYSLDTVSDFNYPFLVKEHFGNHSKGIYHISDLSEFKAVLKKLKEKEVTTVAIQELIDNDSDFRVIVIGDKVYQTYKRDKAQSESWTTTSTSNGSIIDFSPLKKDLEDKFIQFTNLLNLSNAAYDASIINDEIIIYEVSSSYLTNPEPPEKFKNKPYIHFKKRYFDFAKSRVNIVFFLRHQWVKEQLRHYSKDI
tara:strand:- start:909 stop:1982 length:1074 start_codon:yes stop_codon:yes gene_type:complete